MKSLIYLLLATWGLALNTWEKLPCFIDGFATKIFTSGEEYNSSLCINIISLAIDVVSGINATLSHGVSINQITSIASNVMFIIERGYFYCSSIIDGISDLVSDLQSNLNSVKNLQFSDIFLNVIYSSAGLIKNLRYGKRIGNDPRSTCYNYTSLGQSWGDTVYTLLFNSLNLSMSVSHSKAKA